MNSLELVQDEIASALGGIDRGSLAKLTDAFADRSHRWFLSGQGRSRLVASMAAMRLMHAGFDVHLTGGVTTPAIESGDFLLMLSASGETPVSIHIARRAADLGAQVLAVTTRDDSSLAAIADTVVTVPVDGTSQFGGSLFEQASLLLLDSLIIDLTDNDPDAHDTMSRRHTNLE